MDKQTRSVPSKQEEKPQTLREGPIVIDLDGILRKRLPVKVSRLLPRFVTASLERLIRQKELNEILRITYPGRGSEFAGKVLNHLEIKVEINGLDNIPEGKRLMFASNHPLGGLDGITLIAVLGEKFGDHGIRFLVNDMLMNVEPLQEMFLPVNKFGKQGRDAAKAINDAMESEMQIFQFPAGLCSRRQKKGEIKDLEWQKSFVAMAIRHKRDIVPVYFEGSNSAKFYNTAYWRKKLGINFNIEQILLPSEVCKAKGNCYRIVFGTPISWQTLRDSGKTPKELASQLRSVCYSLSENLKD